MYCTAGGVVSGSMTSCQLAGGFNGREVNSVKRPCQPTVCAEVKRPSCLLSLPSRDRRSAPNARTDVQLIVFASCCKVLSKAYEGLSCRITIMQVLAYTEGSDHKFSISHKLTPGISGKVT